MVDVQAMETAISFAGCKRTILQLEATDGGLETPCVGDCENARGPTAALPS